MTTTTHKNVRMHGVDALRAVAMLIGIFFHATIAYKVFLTPSWPYDSTYHHWIFDFFYFFIHSFRMPLFYLIAGYFTRLLYLKLGEKEFIKHRIKRILIPFLVSIISVLPLTIFVFLSYTYAKVYPGDWQKIFAASFLKTFSWNGFAHLWFLYYLLIYYFFTICIKRLFAKNPLSHLKTGIHRTGAFIINNNAVGLPTTALFLWFILMMKPGLYPEVDTSILPNLSFLLYYALFFILGYVFQGQQPGFQFIIKHFRLFLPAGILLNILLFAGDFQQYFSGLSLIIVMVVKYVVALQIIVTVYGWIGFFLSYCKSESRIWRYISDASYWMYLMHLWIIAGMQMILMYFFPIPGILKFPVVLIVTTLITLASYHFFVRYTIIGTYLHGKRDRKQDGQKKRKIPLEKNGLKI